MEFLVEILFFLSTALLLPVVAALLAFVAWSLLEIGGFAREARERRRWKTAWEALSKTLHAQSRPDSRLAAAEFFGNAAFGGLMGVFCRRGRKAQDNEVQLGKLVSDIEIEAASRLARMSLAIRVGPILGLMGTLIPLGPALMGLSSGNIDQLARNLVVAFSTTVLGLFVGGVSYAIWLARRQWYAADMAEIEYIYLRCLADEGNQQYASTHSQPTAARGASTAAR